MFGTGSHGLLFGLVLFSGTLGGAIGPLMAGRIFDLTGSYRLVFIILTAMALVGVVLITTLRPAAKKITDSRAHLVSSLLAPAHIQRHYLAIN